MVNILQEERTTHRNTSRQYEILWERELELAERISIAWEGAREKADLADIMNGLDQVMTTLQDWSKNKFGNSLQELSKSRRLESLLLNNADQKEIRNATDQINELLYHEEMMWLQSSRVTWLKEGDKNTKKFHQKAKWRVRRNKIKKLKDDEGVWKEVPTDMERMATSYFKELFTRDPSLNSDVLINITQEKVTPAMNDALCRDFTDEEISDSMFQISSLKAPGVDGFPARFYQQKWGTIKKR